MKKVLFMVSLLAMGMSMLTFGGISASADVQTATESVHEVTAKAKTIYAPDGFRFTTIGAPSKDKDSKEKVSLEDFLTQEIRSFNSDFIDIQSYKVTADDLKETFSKILCENPDLFYLSEQYGYAWDENDCIVGVQFNYKTTQSGYEEEKAKIDAKFAPLVDSITDDMSDYEKALLAHDFLCTNFSYDNSYTVYNLMDFVEYGTGVCQAYYQAYSYLMEEFGINSYPIQSESLNHIWNVIELDGDYYQVDATWDDYSTDLLGWASHKNFLADDNTSAQQHQSNGVVDWYTYEDVSATNDQFNSYAFRSQNNPFVMIGSNICYLDNGTVCKYDLSTDTSTPINQIMESPIWYNLDATIKGSYFREKFYSLNTYKDITFVNTPEKVLVLNSDSQVIDTIYTVDDPDKLLIFGMTIQDGYIVLQLESNPNVEKETFGSQIVAVANVDEYYQNYSANKDTFTVSQNTTTTEPVTTTESITTTTTTEPVTTTTTTSKPPVTTTTTTTTTTAITTTPPDTTTTYSYDLDGNGSIDVYDLLALNSYVFNGVGSENSSYDINHDGKVNFLDVVLLKKALLQNS
jgi:hypothetical protein